MIFRAHFAEAILMATILLVIDDAYGAVRKYY